MALTMKTLAMIAICIGMVASEGENPTYEVDSMNVKENIINEKETFPYGDCHALAKAGYVKNGTYRLHIDGKDYLAPCIMENGNGAVVFLLRTGSIVAFDRTYAEYENGFGSPSSGNSFFLGLNALHKLTQNYGNDELYSIVEDWAGSKRWSEERGFSVQGSDKQYRMMITGSHHGSLPDDLRANSGQYFYARDRSDYRGCARFTKAGWWFNDKSCSKALPTGKYYHGGKYTPTGGYADGIYWLGFHNDYGYSLRKVTMSVRPQNH